MGRSQAEKAETHERIVQLAAKRFREVGVDGIGVADLMKEAGLTVGGFYKHFASREDLVVEALQAALAARRARAKKGERTFEGLVDEYLDVAHRDDPGGGCVLAALACDVARGSGRVADVYTDQVRHDIRGVAALLNEKDPEEQRGRAIFVLSALVGALELSRAVSDEALSKEILNTVKAELKAPAPKKRAR